MNITYSEKAVSFRPFVINIDVDSKEDLDLLQDICFYNQTIPKLADKYLAPETIDAFQKLLKGISNIVELK